MNINKANEKAWDKEVDKNNYWTRLTSKKSIEDARKGMLRMTLTPIKFVPLSWLNYGKDVLALAAAGGQQGPLLAAAGYNVTVFDISEKQLNQDRKVAENEKLTIKTVKGDMNDLSCFEKESFSMVINPTSLNFIKDINVVFKEVHKVLKPEGAFIFSIANPAMYLFDVKKLEKNKIKVKYTLPYDAEISLSAKQKNKMAENNETFEFSHTLDNIIGSLCKTGFIIKDMYSDYSDFDKIDSFLHDCYLAFLAIKV